MLLAIVSDSHDDLPRIVAAIDLLTRHRAQAILHAGDIIAPFSLQPFLDSGLPVMGVFGNNDGASIRLHQMCPGLHHGPHTFEIGQRRIIAAHDRLHLPRRPDADLCVYGHSHKAALSRNGTRSLNPGEIYGASGHDGSIALVELDTMDIRFLNLTTGKVFQP